MKGTKERLVLFVYEFINKRPEQMYSAISSAFEEVLNSTGQAKRNR